MDNETQQIYAEGEAISEFVKSRAWGLIKTRFDAKVLDLQSTRNIKQDTAEKIAIEVAARNAACDILIEFWQEIDGLAEQHQSNQPLTNDHEIIIQTS